MGRIIIIDDNGGGDDSWILIIIFVLFVIGSIVIWPILIDSYNSSENSEEQKALLLFAGISLISCLCITLIYIITLMCSVSKGIKGLCEITFSKAFWVICSITAIATSVISFAEELVISEQIFETCLVALLCAGVPSFFAACICVIWRERQWKKIITGTN